MSQIIHLTKRCSQPAGPGAMTSSRHVYEIRPRKDRRGVDLISDALPFGRLWYQCRRLLSIVHARRETSSAKTPA
jgi:hypothetical protein